MRPSYAPKFKVSIKLHPSCEVGPYYYGIQCKENATAECRAAVEEWAWAYQVAPNVNDPECHDEDPNYMMSREAARMC